MLRQKLDGNRVILSPKDRATLLHIGGELDQDVKDVLGIVTHKTYQRWLRCPHQSLGNRTLTPSPERPPPLTDDADIGPIRCQRFLGGLLRHYYRDAA